MATLHVGIDEAGCFGFNKSGSKYFIITAAYTYDPAPLASALTNLRFGLMKAGHDLPSFHCCDHPHHRGDVFATMLASANWNFASIVLEKRKINPVLRDPDGFYVKFATPLLRFLFRGCTEPGTNNVVICTDTIATNRRREGILKALKTNLRAELPGATTRIYTHPKESNKWIQVADFCSWAIQRKWERGDRASYDLIRPRLVKTELDLCARGDQQIYY